jgi:hypothetical protein
MVGQLENFGHGQNLAYVHTGEFDNHLLSAQRFISTTQAAWSTKVVVPFQSAELWVVRSNPAGVHVVW